MPNLKKIMLTGLCAMTLTTALAGCGNQSNLANPNPNETAFNVAVLKQSPANTKFMRNLRAFATKLTQKDAFQSQFKAVTDVNDLSQLLANVDELKSPKNNADDHTLIAAIAALQLLKTPQSQDELQQTLTTENQLDKSSVKSVLNHLNDYIDGFSWNQMAYENTKIYGLQKFNDAQPITQQAYTYLQSQNYDNNAINYVLTQISTDQQANTKLNTKILNSRVSTKQATDETIVTEFAKAYLIHPMSKNQLLANLINHNGFDRTTINNALNAMALDFTVQARIDGLKIYQTHQTIKMSVVDNLANAIIEHGYTQDQALTAARTILSNTYNTAAVAQAERARLKAFQAKQKAEQTREDALKKQRAEAKKQAAIDKATSESEAKIRAKKARADSISASESRQKAKQDSSSNTDSSSSSDDVSAIQKADNKAYQKLLADKPKHDKTNQNQANIVANYLMSKISTSNSFNPSAMLKTLTNSDEKYYFASDTAQTAINNAISHYDYSYKQLAQSYINENHHLPKTQLKTNLKTMGYPTNVINNVNYPS